MAGARKNTGRGVGYDEWYFDKTPVDRRYPDVPRGWVDINSANMPRQWEDDYGITSGNPRLGASRKDLRQLNDPILQEMDRKAWEMHFPSDPRMQAPAHQGMYPRGNRPNEVPSGAGGDGMEDGRDRQDLPRNSGNNLLLLAQAVPATSPAHQEMYQSGNNLMQLAQAGPNTYAVQNDAALAQRSARQPWPMERGTPGGRAWDMLTRLQPGGRSVLGHHWAEGWPGPHVPLQIAPNEEEAAERNQTKQQSRPKSWPETLEPYIEWFDTLGMPYDY